VESNELNGRFRPEGDDFSGRFSRHLGVSNFEPPLLGLRQALSKYR
jgi:hypothetical protein